MRMTAVKDMGKARSADGKKLRSLGGAWHNVCLHQGLVSMGRCHQDWNDDRGRLSNCVAPFGDEFQGGELVCGR